MLYSFKIDHFKNNIAELYCKKISWNLFQCFCLLLSSRKMSNAQSQNTNVSWYLISVRRERSFIQLNNMILMISVFIFMIYNLFIFEDLSEEKIFQVLLESRMPNPQLDLSDFWGRNRLNKNGRKPSRPSNTLFALK